MIDQIRTVYRGGTGEIVEKKSRFIATVRLVESEEEALSCLEALRKKYWDARHNCFVYIIGENQETVRCSDAGEPSGTAGRPMLAVVQGAGLRNVLVVVTRYFGGTLLGTGGLVRAYSQAVQEGLANSVLIDEICGVRLLIETDYNGIGKIQYLLGQRGIPILESEYTDQVKIRVLVPKTEVDRLCAEITEGKNGKAKLAPAAAPPAAPPVLQITLPRLTVLVILLPTAVMQIMLPMRALFTVATALTLSPSFPQFSISV